jgi:hypothetical protein
VLSVIGKKPGENGERIPLYVVWKFIISYPADTEEKTAMIIKHFLYFAVIATMVFTVAVVAHLVSAIFSRRKKNWQNSMKSFSLASEIEKG